eukprot:TRINITY_DN9543_c0_g1_i1.p1 TRINITY_DN9543_c0_g1~~TRINITY_DN9543_c0_g1_i1.p1  ORF type:complete len:284 (-),score=59.13 TRINITY_DN9543_c0_g1_i1:157-1008(-)
MGQHASLSKKNSKHKALDSNNKSLGVKVVLFGDTNVGKSAMALRFLKHCPADPSTLQPHIGASFGSKLLSIHNIKTNILLWDTAGMKRYRSVLPLYSKECCIAIFCYDITSTASFHTMQTLLEDKDINMKQETNKVTVIVGLKADLRSQQQVHRSQVEGLVKSHNALFFEVSAMDPKDDSVGVLFKAATAVWLENQGYDVGSSSTLVSIVCRTIARMDVDTFFGGMPTLKKTLPPELYSAVERKRKTFLASVKPPPVVRSHVLYSGKDDFEDDEDFVVSTPLR